MFGRDIYLMFVAIDNNEMNVPQVLDWINRTKNANDNVISPEFAMEILSKTNFFGHIKAVLKNIKDRCKTKEEILPYKEFILSCVDRREMSDEAMKDLVALAEVCCCEKEFNDANGKIKIYEKTDCNNSSTRIVKSREEFEALSGENLKIFFDTDKIDLSNCDFGKAESIGFREGIKLNLKLAYNLPKMLDLSMCEKANLKWTRLSNVKDIRFKNRRQSAMFKFSNGVYFNGRVLFTEDVNEPERFQPGSLAVISGKDDFDYVMSNFSPVGLDVLFDMDEVNLSDKMLGKFNSISFKKGAKFIGRNIHDFPSNIDFSNCSSVDLYSASGFSGTLDFSTCEDVSLHYADLEGVKDFKFLKGAKVDLRNTKNLPEVLDISPCDCVDACNSNLQGVKEIKFGKENMVNFFGAFNFYEKIDVSECKSVCFSLACMRGVKEVRFRDRTQCAESYFCSWECGVVDYKGTVKYAEDEKAVNVVSKSGGLEM